MRFDEHTMTKFEIDINDMTCTHFNQIPNIATSNPLTEASRYIQWVLYYLWYGSFIIYTSSDTLGSPDYG